MPGDLDITYEINESPDGNEAQITLDNGPIDQRFGLTRPADLNELQTTQAALRDALLSVQGQISNLERQLGKKPDGRSTPALRKALQQMLERQKQLQKVIETESQLIDEEIRKLTGQE